MTKGGTKKNLKIDEISVPKLNKQGSKGKLEIGKNNFEPLNFIKENMKNVCDSCEEFKFGE